MVYKRYPLSFTGGYLFGGRGNGQFYEVYSDLSDEYLIREGKSWFIHIKKMVGNIKEKLSFFMPQNVPQFMPQNEENNKKYPAKSG